MHHQDLVAERRCDGAQLVDANSICVVMNGSSGKRRGREGERELRALLEAHAMRFDVRTPGRGGDIENEARRALAEGFGTIVAAGGDGTICAVASALVGTECRMGVLPMGTFNYFARSLDLPEGLEACISVIETGHVRSVKVGEVNGRVFLNNASLGAYPAILKRREDVYRRWGRSRIAAYWSVLTTLVGFHRPMRVTVTLDGEDRAFRTPLVFAASNPYQLEQLGMEGVECARDGGLALFIGADRRGFDLLRSAFRVARGVSVRHEDFEMLCGAAFTVATKSKRRLVARDGEKGLVDGPFRFRARPGALNVLVPPDASS